MLLLPCMSAAAVTSLNETVIYRCPETVIFTYEEQKAIQGVQYAEAAPAVPPPVAAPAQPAKVKAVKAKSRKHKHKSKHKRKRRH